MKERLDIILVNRGYVGSRSRARELILAGKVYVDGRKADKAGSFYESDNAVIEVRGDELRFVSRGGSKLEKAMEKWQLDLKGKICMDIGASTGGFTDCMLQYGAAKVYSVDVGHNQLAEKLRIDPRVVCMEHTNFRYMSREDIKEELDFAAVDVSFISLTKILSPAGNLLRDGGQMVCLIKPQFEAGKGRVGKNGVVREPGIHREVIAQIVDHASAAGYEILNLDYSPIRGPEGNIEYLLHLEKKGFGGKTAVEEVAEMEIAASGAVTEKNITAKSIMDKNIMEETVEEMSCSLKWEKQIFRIVEAAWSDL